MSPSFTPLSALAGGALVGLAASLLLVLSGRVAGVSGIVGGLVRPERGEWGWRTAFVAGLLVGGVALALASPMAGRALLAASPRGLGALAVAGLLVGYGARLGRGCTSGHGVCGLSRLSKPSLYATLTFMATGIATATAVRLLAGA
jgi:uncharacterized membrane protein YedE/YeeE